MSRLQLTLIMVCFLDENHEIGKKVDEKVEELAWFVEWRSRDAYPHVFESACLPASNIVL